MASQGGQVPVEQSDMGLALNMATLAKEGFSRTARDKTQQQIMKLRGDVSEEMMRGVVFLGLNKVKAGIERQPAMIHENKTDGYHPSQIGSGINPPTCWRGKPTGAPQPWLAPPQPGMPPAPPGDSKTSPSSETEGVPPRYVYMYTPLPNTQFCNLDLYVKDCKSDKDFIPDLLSDEGPCTG